MRGKLLAFGLCLMAAATIGVVQLQTHAAVENTRDCDQFAVVRCGTITGDELRAEYDTSNVSSSNGSTVKQADIAKVFSALGISRADLNGTFQTGTVYQNGTVLVNGKVVATDAVMGARNLGGSPIAGTGASKVSVSAMATAHTALVKFDQNGKFLFAVMKPCGNPVSATATKPPAPKPPAPQPSAVCKSLSVATIESTKFRFTAQAEVSGGASIHSYNFEVSKNGTVISTIPSTTSATQTSVDYTQATPGSYTVRATVKTSLGDQSSADCVKQFSVPTPQSTPPKILVQKTVNGVKHAVVNVNSPFTYEVAVTNQSSSTTLTNVVVTDTAPTGIQFNSASSGQIENNAWTYTIASMSPGETIHYTINAQATQASTTSVVNTVCVDTAQIPGSPDSCDTASTETPPENMAQVCNPATGDTMTVAQSDVSKYKPLGSPECGSVQVCDTSTNQMATVTQSVANSDTNRYTTDQSRCQPQTASELPTTGITDTVMQVVGASSLVGAGAYYIASRRQHS